VIDDEVSVTDREYLSIIKENLKKIINTAKIILPFIFFVGVLSAQESTVPRLAPRLMVFYGGELDTFIYEQVTEQIVIDTLYLSEPGRRVVAPLIVEDTVEVVLEVPVPADTLTPVLYSELKSMLDMPVIPPEEVESVFSDCLSDSCIRKMADDLQATDVLIWRLHQNRRVVQLSMELMNTGGQRSNKTTKVMRYYKGVPDGLMKMVRRACWQMFRKPLPKELAEEGYLRELGLMVEYHIGQKNAVLGAGVVSAAGLFAILQQGEEPTQPGIGLPPEWPGE